MKKSVLADIEMNLDADYVCNSQNDIYTAALEIQTLLNETYGMNTTLSETTNTLLGSGYEIIGKYYE